MGERAGPEESSGNGTTAGTGETENFVASV
jgi:hypothetical protein